MDVTERGFVGLQFCKSRSGKLLLKCTSLSWKYIPPPYFLHLSTHECVDGIYLFTSERANHEYSWRWSVTNNIAGTDVFLWSNNAKKDKALVSKRIHKIITFRDWSLSHFVCRASQFLRKRAFSRRPEFTEEGRGNLKKRTVKWNSKSSIWKTRRKETKRGLQALSVQFRFAFSKPSSSQTCFLNRSVAAPADTSVATKKNIFRPICVL